MKPVLVRDATISTLQVGISTLRIGTKQMTLAVFRQLQQETLFSPFTHGNLNGIPWGVVHYRFGSCTEHSSKEGHQHVVWQSGDELRRSSFCAHQHCSDEYIGYLKALNSGLNDEQAHKLIEEWEGYSKLVGALTHLFIAV